LAYLQFIISVKIHSTFYLAVAAEVFAPKITRKSVEKSLKELRQTYGDSEDDDVSITDF
jgi:hypothetical protein